MNCRNGDFDKPENELSQGKRRISKRFADFVVLGHVINVVSKASWKFFQVVEISVVDHK